MIHPDTELRAVSDAVGLGVFATREMPRGTVVWALDELDRRLSLEQVRRLPGRYRRLLDRYGFLNARGERILCWDAGRYVNHSCEPNALPTPWSFDLAVRDIRAGEEITNDYATLNLERSFRCHCGAPSCRRWVRPSDFECWVPRWDAEIAAALPLLDRVPQPLWGWIGPRAAARRCSADPGRAPSIATLRLEAARADPLAFAAVPRRTQRRGPLLPDVSAGVPTPPAPPARSPSARGSASRPRRSAVPSRRPRTG